MITIKGILSDIDTIIQWTHGKKTYIISVVGTIISLLEALGYIHLSDDVWKILMSLGLATGYRAVSSMGKK